MKVAIVGGGKIGAVHALAYRDVGASLVAVVEPSPATGQAFADRFDVPCFASLQELLSSEHAPEAISICSPPSSHRALAEAALEGGLHVLCEKPIAHTLYDAQAIHRAAERSNSVFATGYCHRFQPELELIAEQIRVGMIGHLRTFANAFSGLQEQIEQGWFGRKELAGGGALMDASVHSIDIFRFLCGEIKSATGLIETGLDGTELEVEHTGAICLRGQNGTIGTIESSWKSPAGHAHVRVSGSEGALTFDYSRPGRVRFEPANGPVEILEVETGSRFEREVEAFLTAIDTRTAPRTGAEDGVIGLAVLDSIYRAEMPDIPSLAKDTAV